MVGATLSPLKIHNKFAVHIERTSGVLWYLWYARIYFVPLERFSVLLWFKFRFALCSRLTESIRRIDSVESDLESIAGEESSDQLCFFLFWSQKQNNKFLQREGYGWHFWLSDHENQI